MVLHVQMVLLVMAFLLAESRSQVECHMARDKEHVHISVSLSLSSYKATRIQLGMPVIPATPKVDRRIAIQGQHGQRCEILAEK
jgi:hypothetical protein